MDPAEAEMRTQMFKSLAALERMCDAVTEHLTADKQPPEQDTPEPPKAPTEEGLAQLGKVVAKHHQALGLLATFGMMKDATAFGTPPAGRIAILLGMQACRNCVGTGWVARDETCDECGRTGYVKA